MTRKSRFIKCFSVVQEPDWLWTVAGWQESLGDLGNFPMPDRSCLVGAVAAIPAYFADVLAAAASISPRSPVARLTVTCECFCT
jgi:hypothetical protein